MLDNKKAQVGESLMWLVATIAIIVILIIGIYAAIALGKAKEVTSVFSGNSQISYYYPVERAKTDFALSINDSNKDKIMEWVNENEK